VAEEEEQLDVDGAIRKLNAALRLQHRSVLQYALVAGSLTGWQYQGLADRLTQYAEEELHDLRRLVEKVVSFEGEPQTTVAKLGWTGDPANDFEALIEAENETIEALQAAIEPTGREGRSEALEHRLEHMIMRKQEQVDFLDRARRT
jgi:bacterioferritin (cytochrome b1)